MKKFWAVICTVVMLGATISVAGVQDPNAGDIDGDTNRNPWEDLLTSVSETTEEVKTTLDDVTSEEVKTSSDETTPQEVKTTPNQTTPEEGSTEKVETTVSQVETESKTGGNITTSSKVTQQISEAVKVKRTKINKAAKKKNSKKVYLKLKKIKGAQKYQIQISKSKKFKKILIKKTVKKAKITITSKKNKNQKKLYVRARAIRIIKGQRYKGEWSKVARIKISKR